MLVFTNESSFQGFLGGAKQRLRNLPSKAVRHGQPCFKWSQHVSFKEPCSNPTSAATARPPSHSRPHSRPPDGGRQKEPPASGPWPGPPGSPRRRRWRPPPPRSPPADGRSRPRRGESTAIPRGNDPRAGGFTGEAVVWTFSSAHGDSRKNRAIP